MVDLANPKHQKTNVDAAESHAWEKYNSVQNAYFDSYLSEKFRNYLGMPQKATMALAEGNGTDMYDSEEEVNMFLKQQIKKIAKAVAHYESTTWIEDDGIANLAHQIKSIKTNTKTQYAGQIKKSETKDDYDALIKQCKMYTKRILAETAMPDEFAARHETVRDQDFFDFVRKMHQKYSR